MICNKQQNSRAKLITQLKKMVHGIFDMQLQSGVREHTAIYIINRMTPIPSQHLTNRLKDDEIQIRTFSNILPV